MADGFLSFMNMGGMSDRHSLEQILMTNQQSSQYGLQLTSAEAAELLDTRRKSLQDLDRIEFGCQTIIKLIEAFQDSAYLLQQNYADTINELLELFYIIKTESLEEIADDDLIALMKKHFETDCGGSIELLSGRDLIRIARNYRFGRSGEDDGTDEEEEAFTAENAADIYANEDYYAGYEYYEGCGFDD